MIDAQFLALSIIILLFSVIVHEVMHGLLALKFGDRTAENAGRLTLNPIPHIDPVGTILVPGLLLLSSFIPGSPGIPFLIGWAKPVPVNPLNFDNLRTGELFVSLSGVFANFSLALVAATIFHLFPNQFIQQLMQFTVSINLMLGVFNLLPIPPLDGSKALLSQLPYQLAKEYEKISNYGFLLILLLLYFGVIGLILRLIVIPLHTLLQVPPF